MGYMHIELLHKCPEFFELFEEVYCMEKIHGTTTWILFEIGKPLHFHSGGEKFEDFKALFNEDLLTERLNKISLEKGWTKIKIHGEGYGGKQQKMSETYGEQSRFIAFDIHIECSKHRRFLNVPEAEKISLKLGLEFVDYNRGPNCPEWIEQQTCLPSTQAIRNGVGDGKLREGVVIRPIRETRLPNGKRAIFKNKNEQFWEIATKRPLGQKLKIAKDISLFVQDWVTEQRFEHVIDRVLQQKDNKNIERDDIRNILVLLTEDVQRESEGEIIWSKEIARQVSKAGSVLFRKKFPELLKD